MRELDRWYAEQESAPGVRRGDGRRRLLVAGVTALVAVLATGRLLQHEGTSASGPGCTSGPAPDR
jgi:hypothetical protein